MAITAGGSLNSTPAPQKQTLNTNYLDFTGTTDTTWAQQYLPDLMEREAEVFGNRTVSGFLSQVGAEEAMSADQVVWSEQGRLHLAYKCSMIDADQGIGGDNPGCEIEILTDMDGQDPTTNHGIRVNDTVIVAGGTGQVFKGIVTQASAGSTNIEVVPYDANDSVIADGTDNCTILVYGSEYEKGRSYLTADGYTDAGAYGTATDQRGANEPKFQTYSNKPIILKDYYEVSGSDTARIGWVEVTGESGVSGYLWYLKAEGETRSRFTDYLEMSMIEGVKASGTNDADLILGGDGNETGTEGLFAAIESRGNMTSGVTGVNAATDLAEFDAILAEFDKQGAIEENMIFCNRATALAIDDMLASMNSYGAGGTSYGVFDNDEDMALNLGFSGFRRGSYDFYKSDWKYLNDRGTRGGINDAAGAEAIRGVFIPAGVSTVYDQQLGKNLKRPFLHVRYRASATDNRRFKTWVTGSVGAATSALDAMQIHMLSERCLVTQGANNFMLMK
tara:strand:- start:1037 stop:2548 length:1512 start_codon:yes stop_codon:yes gene_type:complete